MEYPVAEQLTTNHQKIGWKTDLSPRDIEFIAEFYPESNSQAQIHHRRFNQDTQKTNRCFLCGPASRVLPRTDSVSGYARNLAILNRIDDGSDLQVRIFSTQFGSYSHQPELFRKCFSG